MSFQETVNSLINDGYECALTMEKSIIFAESVIREYNINCEEAELKVLKESGTDEDFNYLCEAAKEGLVVKLKKAIKKMIQALKDFIANVIDKIKVTYASKKAKDALKRLEEASNTNPKIKSMKISVHDGEKDEKVILEAIDKLYAQEAKLKGGASVDSVRKAVDNIKETAEKKRQKIAKAATLTLTVGAAIVIMKKYINKLENENSEVYKEAHKYVNGKEDISADDDTICQTLFNLNSSIIVLLKERISSGFGFVKELGYKIKGQMAVPNLEESVDDTMEDETYSESYDEDIYTPATTVEENVDEVMDIETPVDESYVDDLFNFIESTVTATENEDETIDSDADTAYESTIDTYLDHLMNDSDSDDAEETTTECTVSDLDAMLDDMTSNFITESENAEDVQDSNDEDESEVTTESSDTDIDSMLDELISSI